MNRLALLLLIVGNAAHASSEADARARAALALAAVQAEVEPAKPKLKPKAGAPLDIGNWHLEAHTDGMPRGWHFHVCECCGFIWRHHDSPKPNKLEDHICPRCQALPPHQSGRPKQTKEPPHAQPKAVCPLPGGI